MLNKISIALLAAASVVSLCMLPRTGTDAAKLLPAQVLVIAQEDGRITVESDNGASGSGTTLPDALAAMREGAEGTLFLDTAEHIILLQSTQSLLPAAVRQRQFRPAAKLYLARMDALDAAAYIAHISGVFEITVQILVCHWLKDWLFHYFSSFGAKVVPGNCGELIFVLI